MANAAINEKLKTLALVKSNVWPIMSKLEKAAMLIRASRVNLFVIILSLANSRFASFMALFALFLSKGSQKKLEQLIFFTMAISSALLVFYSFKKFPTGREATHSPSNIILAPYWAFLILIVFVILEKKLLLPHARKSKAFYVSYAYIWFSIWTLSFFFMITHTSILSLAALINFVALLRIAFDFLLIKVPPIHVG